MTPQEQPDSQAGDELDAILNNLVADHIDIRGMDKESGLAWVEDYFTAKAAFLKWRDQEVQKQVMAIIGEDIELRADIDDELLSFVPDMQERSLEVTGVPSSFTNLYTRAIVRSVQQKLRTAAARLGQEGA